MRMAARLITVIVAALRFQGTRRVVVILSLGVSLSVSLSLLLEVNQFNCSRGGTGCISDNLDAQRFHQHATRELSQEQLNNYVQWARTLGAQGRLRGPGQSDSIAPPFRSRFARNPGSHGQEQRKGAQSDAVTRHAR